jgi:TetR/AcrR family transcriptional regulator, transcriptional repressor for nem operon
MSISKQATLAWRHRFRAMFDRIADLYEMEDPVDLDHLADMVSNTAEGAIIMAKSMQDPQIVPQQILLLRSYLKLLFQRRKVQ